MNYQIGFARGAHMLSSVWVFILAGIIIIDVVGRVVFLQPLPGTKEILQNSVIAVTFLQLPLAIYSGSMLRTTMIVDKLGPRGQTILRIVKWTMGALLFLAIAYASWPSAMTAIRLGEYEGEGALRIYTWPIRLLLVGSSIFAAFAYISMLIADLRGKVDAETGSAVSQN